MRLTRMVIGHLGWISLAGFSAAPWAFGAASASETEQTMRMAIIVGTVLGAVLIGLLLYQFSQRSSQAQFKGSSVSELPAARAAVAEDTKLFMPVVLEQLNQLAMAPEQRQRVARTVSEIVTQTFEKQVNTVKRQLNDQYGQVIEEKRRNEAILQRKYQDTLTEKKQTVAILESIAEGLVVVNNRGEVVMMNPAAERLLAVNQQERVGKPLTENLRDEQLVSLVKGSKDHNQEIVLSAKQDRTKRVLRASNAVITDENGTTVGMVAVLSDVTRQRELDQLKSEFVSKVGHELRTPIVAMRHALSILTDQVAGPMSEEQQKFAGIVQRNLERLGALINDLLDLSKLEAHKMELRLEPNAIGAVIQTVCDSLDAWAKTKAIAISKRVPDDLPAVPFDQARITQVLTNLVGNAIKFTPKQGRITVEAKLDQEQQAVVVSVSDTGIGIAKEDLPKLFNKFQQVGERTASDISGTGLGLAITKEIIELHHGRVWAESELQQGTRFVFTLPLTQPSVAVTPG